MPIFKIRYYNEAKDETPCRGEEVDLPDADAAAEHARSHLREDEKLANVDWMAENGAQNTLAVGPGDVGV